MERNQDTEDLIQQLKQLQIAQIGIVRQPLGQNERNELHEETPLQTRAHQRHNFPRNQGRGVDTTEEEQRNNTTVFHHKPIPTDRTLNWGDRIWVKNKVAIRGRRVTDKDRKGKVTHTRNTSIGQKVWFVTDNETHTWRLRKNLDLQIEREVENGQQPE